MEKYLILPFVFLMFPVVFGWALWRVTVGEEKRAANFRELRLKDIEREVLVRREELRAEEHARHRDCIVHRHFNINTGEDK